MRASRVLTMVRDSPPIGRNGTIRWLLALSSLAGLMLVFLVPPGLPYDEPSHWSVVTFIDSFQQLPVMGEPGVPYQAQQGPLAYLVAVLAVSVAQTFWDSPTAAFYAVRVVGGLEFVLASLLAYLIIRRLLPGRPAALAAAGYLVLSPMFLAIGWSVQNDGLMLVLAFACILLLIKKSQPTTSLLLLAGLLAGLALVTKLTAFPLIVGAPIWLMLRPGRSGRFRSALTFMAAVVVAAGWWFVRNVVLYGSLTPPTDLNGGPSFPPFGYQGALQTPLHMVRDVITYLWVPTEYYRNQLTMPVWCQALLAVLTACILVLGFDGLRRTVGWRWPGSLQAAFPDPWLLVGIVGLISILAWAVTFVVVSSVAPRFGYLALPLWLGLIGMAMDRLAQLIPRRIAPVAWVIPGAVAMALTLWVLFSVRGVDASQVAISF